VVKSIVTLQGAYTGYFAFTTSDGYVRLLNPLGQQQWRTSVTGASAPLVVNTVGKIYVGGSDGLVHELNISDGTQTKTQNAGGTGVTIGEPSYDGTDNVLYVNTTQGNQYAFTVPF
jgi:outer membrane protein assembly factor BamB